MNQISDNKKERLLKMPIFIFKKLYVQTKAAKNWCADTKVRGSKDKIGRILWYEKGSYNYLPKSKEYGTGWNKEGEANQVTAQPQVNQDHLSLGNDKQDSNAKDVCRHIESNTL